MTTATSDETARERMARPGRAVVLDYPQEGEVIESRQYTFRLSGDARTVELAIDGDGWSPCRKAAGFWWFDWSGYGTGRHQALIRSRRGADGEFTFRTCRFRVELP